jgi:hypothetical protein
VILIDVVDPSLDVPLSERVNLLINSPSEYVAGYDLIARSIHSQKSLHVVITDKRVGHWFLKMAEKYGDDEIIIVFVTPKSIFQKQTGITDIPNAVTDEQIIKSGLLDIKTPAMPNTSFEDFLIMNCFGKFLTTPNGLYHVDEILASFDVEQWQRSMSRPLLRDLFQDRMRMYRQQFLNQGKHAEIKLLEWINISPKVYIQHLFALKVLRGYPSEIGKKVFDEVYPELLKLNLDLRRVPITMTGNERTITEIRLYLQNILVNPESKKFHELLDEVSGLLEIEFVTIHRLLEEGKIELTDDDIKQIRSKFAPLAQSPYIKNALADLDMLIPCKPPSDPEPDWDVAKWLQWVLEEYLPYRYWLENTGQLNDQIGEIANCYAEWFYKNYSDLLFHSEYMAWRSLLNLKDQIKGHSGPVLVIVIDNFNSKFYPDFRSEMQNNGYYEQQVEFCFSLIPSCTEVSKKAIITGHFAPFQDAGYKDQVENVWEQRLEKKVRYLSNISELREVTQLNHHVYFLNYLPLDIVLHQNENHLGISHTQNVRNYLRILTQDIKAFALRLGVERDLMVVVLADHGSTRIPRGTVNVIQKKYYQDRTEDGHHRYIAVSDQELNKLPESVKYDCYVIKGEAYDLPHNYLIARRLYRFLPTDNNAYIHGGLTPEETIIPIAIYQPVTITPNALEILLVSPDKIYVGTKINLCVEITNTNNYSCEDIRIEFHDPNIIAEQANIDQLKRLSRTTIDMAARCPSTADSSTEKINIVISFRFLGQPWEYQKTLSVNIHDPAKTKFDLDNL